MARTITEVVDYVHAHRCFNHPIFKIWASADPDPEVIGALFHQIQKFCASTRPGLGFPGALAAHGLAVQSKLMMDIVESESGHGKELATMAGFILNRRAGKSVCADLQDQDAVERQLQRLSDRILGRFPGYDRNSGLLPQTRKAIEVFERRALTDYEATIRNLGTALALEIVSNHQIIPGEKYCLVDSGLYGARMDNPEMHYLLEHWGDSGAEQQHEQNAISAVGALLDDDSEPLIFAGVDDFLDALSRLWDLLESALVAAEADKEIVGAARAH